MTVSLLSTLFRPLVRGDTGMANRDYHFRPLRVDLNKVNLEHLQQQRSGSGSGS